MKWLPSRIMSLIRGRTPDFGIFTHLTPDEIQRLSDLSGGLPGHSNIVEIGSYLGASSLALAHGARRTHSSVFCVDTWANEGMSEGERDTWPEFQKNIERDRDCITPLRGRSVDIASIFEGNIDLLFLDGDHSWEGVRRDLASWAPKLKPGGWLLMHDIEWAEGVQRALREIVNPWELETPTNLPNLYACRVDSHKAAKSTENAP
jgi:predicted O-methyltransferase YrrM